MRGISNVESRKLSSRFRRVRGSLRRVVWSSSALAFVCSPLKAGDADVAGQRSAQFPFTVFCTDSIGNTLESDLEEDLHGRISLMTIADSQIRSLVAIDQADSILVRWPEDKRAQVKVCGRTSLPTLPKDAQFGDVTVSFLPCPQVQTRAPLLSCDTGKGPRLTDRSLAEWKRIEKRIFLKEGLE